VNAHREGIQLAARHRASIERFTRYYDDVESGLAQYLHDMVVASCLK
jgi:hypothetical protein